MANSTLTSATAILRKDFVAFLTRAFHWLDPGSDFVPRWYVRYLAYELLECQAGNRPRMTISMPPRYGKSTIVSVIFVAWLLGHDPALRIFCVSYAQELAFKHSATFRILVEADWYRELCPKFQLDPNKCSEREVRTLANGYRYATSVGGPGTGLGGSIVILDDIIKAADANSEVARNSVINWMKNTLFSRPDNKAKQKLIVVGQRLHLQDPIGNLLEGGTGWHPVTLPAIAEEIRTYKLARLTGAAEYTPELGEVLDPVREPLEVLKQIMADMGAANFNAQYQQRPEYQEDAYINWEWFKRYEKPPPAFDFVFLSVDPAIATNSTADWSVCLVMGVLGDDNYILHDERKRLGFDALAIRLDQLATTFRADSILIEKAGIGISLIGRLQEEKKHAIDHAPPRGSKKERLLAVLPVLETGHVWVPREAPWLETCRSEFLAFPNGRFDDQVDSLSQFLIHRRVLIVRAKCRRPVIRSIPHLNFWARNS
jgi:predicted phage terminase large subunit-like protein